MHSLQAAARDMQAHVSKRLTFQDRPDVGIWGYVKSPHFTWLRCHQQCVSSMGSMQTRPGLRCPLSLRPWWEEYSDPPALEGSEGHPTEGSLSFLGGEIGTSVNPQH